MCGIAGIIASDPSLISTARLQKMADALAHRGPNGSNTWINVSSCTGFSHRRLSIIDLSNAGSQPMHYLQRYTIVHNGEIYNYTELRSQLQQKGYQFQSLSDTEVILAAYDCYKAGCLQYFDGMFAFCIWDEKEQTLFAARDRFGEKPLYYHAGNNAFCFASEIKALWAAGIEKKINNASLLNYLTLGYTSSPADPAATFYQDINALPAAHYLQLSFFHQQYRFTIKRYWDIDTAYIHEADAATLQQQFRNLFFTSVQRRLRSDVPVGTSLSGGLDSSSVVAAIQQVQQPGYPLKTFSAVFPGYEKDESTHIKAVSQFFGVENFTVTPSAESFLHDFDKLLYYHDEPISSMSVYAQYKVFELAAQHNVTVLLDGQGADELLGGYSKHIHWRLQELLTRHGKHAVQQQITLLNNNAVPFEWSWKNHLAARWPGFTAQRLVKKAQQLAITDPFVTTAFKEHFDKHTIYKPAVQSLNDILYADACRFGLPELLRNADRNSMAHGKEVRLPFLSHQLAGFLFTIPAEFKIHEGYTKRLLRLSMQDLLPASIAWRTDKVGFEAPQHQWLQHGATQERIYEARKTLVDLQILQPAVLYQQKQPPVNRSAVDYDWRHLVAGSMLQ